MSSSTDARGRRVCVVRDAPVHAFTALEDLDGRGDAAWPGVDPDALADAVARGYADGHARGLADGLAAGEAAAAEAARRQRADATAAVDAALDALAAATTEVLAGRDDTVTGLERALAGAAFELAEALLGRELELASSPGRDALTRALRLAEGTEAVVVRMHPDDVATLGDHADLAPGRDVTVVADPTVERHGCLVQVGDGCVDAQLGPALARVREVLAP